jgi:hypothetical protein
MEVAFAAALALVDELSRIRDKARLGWGVVGEDDGRGEYRKGEDERAHGRAKMERRVQTRKFWLLLGIDP